MHRYVVSVHKTEIGAAKAILEEWYNGDMDLFWGELDEEKYEEKYPDGITEGEEYEKALLAAAEKVVCDWSGDRTMIVWTDEQRYGYEIQVFELSE